MLIIARHQVSREKLRQAINTPVVKEVKESLEFKTCHTRKGNDTVSWVARTHYDRPETLGFANEEMMMDLENAIFDLGREVSRFQQKCLKGITRKVVIPSSI